MRKTESCPHGKKLILSHIIDIYTYTYTYISRISKETPPINKKKLTGKIWHTFTERLIAIWKYIFNLNDNQENENQSHNRVNYTTYKSHLIFKQHTIRYDFTSTKQTKIFKNLITPRVVEPQLHTPVWDTLVQRLWHPVVTT